MKKIGIWIIICALILTGCNQRDMVEDNTIKIGLSFDSFVIERWHREQDAFVSKAEELGATVYVQNANGEVDKQIDQIEYFIKEDVDTIVIIPTDADAIVPIIKKAQTQGIKIISYDRLIRNAGTDLYISFDNKMIGELLTQELLNEVEDGENIIVVMGSPADYNVDIIDAEFERLSKRRNIHVLEKVYAENWLSETAFNVVSAHLSEGEEISGIFCGNDDLAQQAIKALSEYRRAGSVCVVGQDGDLSACQRIVEGTQNMTIYKNVIMMARQAAIMAVELAKGETPDIEEQINDGTKDIPYYRMLPEKVNKENMDEVIIQSGFHLKEEVYLNLLDKEEETDQNIIQ